MWLSPRSGRIPPITLSASSHLRLVAPHARTIAIVSLAVSVALIALRAASADQQADFFENKIRPILAGTCFTCHNDTKSSGGLRVDGRERLMQGGDSGAAIMPGQPEESLLIRAVRRQADVSAMPPEADNALRPDQVADLVTWIRDGAKWPEHSATFIAAKHWAFEPLTDPALPEIADRAWVATAVDWFIRARQEQVGHRPAPPADKKTLIRRVTFDLTGLPPTPAEIDAFEHDASPAAFSAVVERLLASPAYGERWGRHWLDVVRYADTAGETADYPLPLAWRYRNYVIAAFQSDKPYDEFLREQIAGDILAATGPADRYAERVTATGYLAISRRFGFDSENYHHLTIQDTIDTLGQSVLGLSLGCARCHDHKFDALSMNDYYALYGIFDSSRYAFPGSEQKQKVRAMAPLLPPAESRARWREHDRRVTQLVESLAGHKLSSAVLRSLSDIDGDFELQAAASGGSKGVLVPPWLSEGTLAVTAAAQSPFTNRYPPGKVGASVPGGNSAYRIEQAIYDVAATKEHGEIFVNLDFRVAAVGEGVREPHRFAIADAHAPEAITVLIASDSIALGDDSAQKLSLEAGKWHNLQLVISRSEHTVTGSLSTGATATTFGRRSLSPHWTGTPGRAIFSASPAAGAAYPAIEIDNLALQDVPLDPARTPQPTSETKPELAAAPMGNGGTKTPASDEPSDAAKQQKAELERLLIEGPVAMAYGISEGTPHDVRIQLRGEPDQPGASAPRGFIRVLGGEPLSQETAGSGRLELAQWLTRSDHPLAARVMVNRIWQYHFGRGLVTTPNDFGVRGAPPTHPELLDHLATQFIRSGWSIKAMHRLILASATYQQASTGVPPAATASHPSAPPELYTSFARRRLSAEELRDAILTITGQLDATAAEQHPFPSPLRWGYTQHSPFIAVYDHQKRSVYLMTQRIKRHPLLALFDGPDPNATTAERRGTTVPTQALFFLNDSFVHAQIDRWAARLTVESPDEPVRIDNAWRRACGRAPTSDEQAEAASFLAGYRQELSAAPAAGVDAGAASLAAYLRVLIGSNEFIHVD